MAPIRVRHPQGVSTIQIDLASASVQDLQQQIFSISEITPSQQELRVGYPPRSLTVVPELPLSSLGLQQGDQLIVTQRLGSGTSVAPSAGLSSAAKSKSVFGPIPAEAAPAPRLRPGAAGPATDTGVDYVETDSGVLIHRIVPDDNSCLFSSIALIFEQDIRKASSIRQVVADVIASDEETWNEAILGRPRQDYITTILKPTSWGGAIELSILSTHYGAEIASVDVETGRIDHFTPLPSALNPSPTSPSSRCILIYSGIHYDAASLAPFPDAPADFHQTVYPILVHGGSDDDDPILAAAKSLADKLRAKKAYTNTATFDLKCEICKKGLKGEKEARAHAAETGHTSFGEF